MRTASWDRSYHNALSGAGRGLFDGGLDRGVRRGRVAVVGEASEHVADLPDIAREHQADSVGTQFLVRCDEHAGRGHVHERSRLSVDDHGA